jgi:negative regulator of flagellin synthesis FlgM
LKITTPTVVTPTGVATRADVARTYGGKASATSSASSAQVDLSPASQQLLALQEGGNDIDLDRVQAIRNAIASGQFSVNPGRIADGLIASIQDLLK